MTTSRSADTRSDRVDDRAKPTGAYIATIGAVILLVSVFLDWLTQGPADGETLPSSGYEGDGVIPFMAYLGLGFALALLYALGRADRRQHRGLSLASFAAGLASLLWAVSFLLDPISTSQYDENVSTEIGPWIGALGALLWTLGSFLLAREPEGDVERRPVQVAHTETRHVEPERHVTTERHVAPGRRVTSDDRFDDRFDDRYDDRGSRGGRTVRDDGRGGASTPG